MNMIPSCKLQLCLVIRQPGIQNIRHVYTHNIYFTIRTKLYTRVYFLTCIYIYKLFINHVYLLVTWISLWLHFVNHCLRSLSCFGVPGRWKFLRLRTKTRQHPRSWRQRCRVVRTPKNRCFFLKTLRCCSSSTSFTGIHLAPLEGWRYINLCLCFSVDLWSFSTKLPSF